MHKLIPVLILILILTGVFYVVNGNSFGLDFMSSEAKTPERDNFFRRPSKLTADIKINGRDGRDGEFAIPWGESWSYTWNSRGATSCKIIVIPPEDIDIEPLNVTFSGKGGPIGPGHLWYSKADGYSQFTGLILECTNGKSSAIDWASVIYSKK